MAGGINFGDDYLKGCGDAAKRWDANGDGKTTVDEIAQNSSIFAKYSDLNEKAISVFQKYAKKDGNNEISAQEYAEALNSKEYDEILDEWKVREYQKRKEAGDQKPAFGLSQPKALIQDNKYMKEVHEVQMSRDTDGNGEVSVDETFAGDYLMHKYPDLGKKDREALIRYAMTDGNINVNDEEFVRWLNGPEHDKILTEFRNREAEEILAKRNKLTNASESEWHTPTKGAYTQGTVMRTVKKEDGSYYEEYKNPDTGRTYISYDANGNRTGGSWNTIINGTEYPTRKEWTDSEGNYRAINIVYDEQGNVLKEYGDNEEYVPVQREIKD